MNWYKFSKKVMASITFYVSDPGVEKISQPKTILDLSNDLFNFITQSKNYSDMLHLDFRDIVPDGYDFSKYEGTINFYTSYKEKEYLLKYIESWIQNKKQEGYKMQVNDDISKMRGGNVYRIKVLYNPSKEIEEMPSLNLSNSNANAILSILGIKSSYSGNILVNNLIERINSISDQNMESIVENPHIDTFPKDIEKGVSIYNTGRSLDYIDVRLQELYNIADFAKANGFKYIGWS